MSVVNSSSDDRVVNNVVRHEYRVLSDEEKADMKMIKDFGLDFITFLDDLETSYGPKQETDIARLKVQEAVMWAVKGITA